MRCIVKKKTLAVIAKSGNNYIVQVKANQPKLLNSLKHIQQNFKPVSICRSQEKSRGRLEIRETMIFKPCKTIPDGWTQIRRVICVKRIFHRNARRQNSNAYYISSLRSDDAQYFADAVRGHWSIENRLHWVKDVMMHEDKSHIKAKNGIETLSILKNIAINICRGHKFDSIKYAAIYFSSNIKELLKIFRT